MLYLWNILWKSDTNNCKLTALQERILLMQISLLAQLSKQCLCTCNLGVKSKHISSYTMNNMTHSSDKFYYIHLRVLWGNQSYQNLLYLWYEGMTADIPQRNDPHDVLTNRWVIILLGEISLSEMGVVAITIKQWCRSPASLDQCMMRVRFTHWHDIFLTPRETNLACKSLMTYKT